jgi:hypothetical protein
VRAAATELAAALGAAVVRVEEAAP